MATVKPVNHRHSVENKDTWMIHTLIAMVTNGI